jgi:hypothetical protein
MKWIPNPLQRRRRNREIAEEVEAHIEEKIAELVESGMSTMRRVLETAVVLILRLNQVVPMPRM